MATVGVAQTASGVVIFGEEERGESAIGGILAKKAIHRLQEALRLVQSDGALAAQIGLEVGHQESGGDSFSRDVPDDESEAFAAQIEKIVVVATDLASLMANSCVFQGSERRQGLREEPGLNFFRNFKFLGSAAFRLKLLSDGPALRFDRAGHFVEADQRER